MVERSRLAWVDMAKGLSILLVVMMYAAYNTGKYTGETGVLHYIIGFATPFRMPEFFLISGLFLEKVIDRPWRAFADRRIVHYLYFYALWVIIDIGLKVGVFAGDPRGMLRDIAMAIVQPYGVLWFIYMLAVFGLIAKVLRQLRVPPAIVVTVAALLQMTATSVPNSIATYLPAYFVFFYLGAVAAPLVFRLVAWAENQPGRAVAVLIVWAGVNGLLVFSPGYAVQPMQMTMGLASHPALHLVLAIAGALALCVGAALLARLPAMDWLRWLGQHSLVIYVAFTLPMSIFRELMLLSGLITATGPLSIAVLVVSLIAPVLLFAATQRTGIGTFLFQRPRWAHTAPEARAPA